MAVTIAILSSLCATIAGFLLHQMSVNSVLKRSLEESERRVKELETEVENLREQNKLSHEANQNKSEKKPPRKLDMTGVYMR